MELEGFDGKIVQTNDVTKVPFLIGRQKSRPHPLSEASTTNYLTDFPKTINFFRNLLLLCNFCLTSHSSPLSLNAFGFSHFKNNFNLLNQDQDFKSESC